MTPGESIVLGMIERAAEAGQVCPTNAEICAELGLSSWGTSSRMVSNLEAAGLITVERFSRSRVATVVATGRRTLRPVEGPSKRQSTNAAAQRDRLAELVAESGSIAQAAKAMQITEARAYQIWAIIRAKLGPQAV